MPRVIKPGNAKPSGPLPAGLKATCHSCGAKLETTNNEPGAKPDTFEDGPQGQFSHPGWTIPCPECGNNVFFYRDR